jgi:hypothetical protein
VRLQEDACVNFAGGMNDSAAPTGFALNEAASLRNVRVLPDGSVARRGGSERLHFDPTVGAGDTYGAANYNGKLLLWNANALYVSGNDGFTWTSAGASYEDWISWATMRHGTTLYLFYCSGGSLYSYDGTTVAVVSAAPTGVRYVAVFGSRLYLAGHAGSRAVASAVRDPFTYSIPDGLDVDVQGHDGQAITGFFATAPHLLVFKGTGAVAYIDGFGEQDLVVAAGPAGITRSVGCLGFRTVQAVAGDAVCWLSERGIEIYRPGDTVKLATPRLAGFFRDAFGKGAVLDDAGLPTAIYLADRQEYMVAVPTATSRNDTLIYLNVATGAATLDDGSSSKSVRAWLTANSNGDRIPAPAAACSDRAVYLWDDGDTDFAGADGTGGMAVTAEVVTRPFVFRAPFNRKQVRLVRVSGIAPGGASLVVKLRGDEGDESAHTVTLPASTNGKPRSVTLRMNARAVNPQVVVQTSGVCRITGVDVQAAVLTELR